MEGREIAEIVESAMEELPDTTEAVETKFAEAKRQGDEPLVDSARAPKPSLRMPSTSTPNWMSLPLLSA